MNKTCTAGAVKTITLSCGNITISMEPQFGTGGGGRSPVMLGHIESEGLKEDLDNPLYDNYNSAIDGLESLVLAHACEGVDVTDTKYVEGIETALEAIANNLG